MPFTKKQLLEKENLEWFCPNLLKQWPPHEGEFEEYLAHSERGVPIKGFEHGYIPHYNKNTFISQKFNVYAETKRRRGITIHEIWEEDFFSGGNFGLIEMLTEEDGKPIPEHIKNYIKKEIFAGQDADLIDKLYEQIKVAV